MVQGEKLRLVVTLKNSSKGSNQILNITDEVCNVVGSSNDKPRGASSWMNFWENETGEKWPKKCAICPKSFEESRSCGGHIHIKGKGAREKQFIIPICVGCNNTRKLDYNDQFPKSTQWAPIRRMTTAARIKD